MPLKFNTIEYGFESIVTPASSSAVCVVPSMSIFIPETLSRKFISVAAQVYFRDSGNALTIFGSAVSVDLFIDGVKSTSQTGSYALQTGEHFSYFAFSDFTNAFNASFIGTNHSVGFRTSFSGSAYCNVNHKLYITYQYEETNTNTGIKTVRIPINSNTGSLTTTQGWIGHRPGLIPNLDSWLPESNKVYRNIFWEYWGKESAGSTAELQMFTQLDTDTEISRGRLTQRANSDVAYYNIQTASLSTYTTNTTHSLRARSNVASRFSNIGAIMHVTYEYNYTGSSNIMNSLYCHGCYLPTYTVFNTISYPKIYDTNTIFIGEKNVILKESAYIVHFAAFQGASTFIGVGNQYPSTYVLTVGGAFAGDHTIIHRIDSGSASGSYGTLISGLNKFTYSMYSSTNVTHNNIMGSLILNYTSLKEDTVGRHTKSIFYLVSGSVIHNRVSPQLQRFCHVRDFPSNYFIVDNHYKIYSNVTQGGPSMVYYQLQRTGSELHDNVGNSGPSSPLIATPNQGLDEYGISIMTNKLSDLKRYPLDKANKVELSISRSLLYGHTASGNAGISTSNHVIWLTFNTDEHLVTGSLSGYTGAGANVSVNFYESGSNDYLFTLNSTASGQFSGSWFNNTIPIYATAVSGNRYAMSEIQVASSSNPFTLDFSSQVISSGEKSFTFIS